MILHSPKLLRVSSIFWLVLLYLPTAIAWALEPIDSREPTDWLGPEILNPEQAGIGKTLADLEYSHLYGGKGSLYIDQGLVGTVVVVRDPECPVSQRYGPRVAKLARSYTEKGFAFIYIYLNSKLSVNALLDDAKRLHSPGIVVGKGSFKLAASLGVASTGDVFVLNSAHQLVYRGAVDDQYGFGYTRQAPTANYLRNALDAVLNNQSIVEPATSAPGCIIDADPKKDMLFPDIPYDAVVS